MSLKKILFFSFCSLFSLFILCIAGLPSFFSTQMGKNLLSSWINQSIDGKIHIDNLNLSWLGRQKVDNLILHDIDGKEILKMDHFETKTPLASFLIRGFTFGDTTVHSFNLLLEQKEKGKETNLQKAVEIKKKKTAGKKKKTSFYPKFSSKLLIHEGTVVFSAPKIHQVTISDIRIEKKRAPHDLLEIFALTVQDTVEGSVKMEIDLEKAAKINAEVKNFPVAILNQLSDSPLFTQGLGNTIDANLSFDKQQDTVFIDADLESANLKAALRGETVNGKLLLSPDSHIRYTLTPSFFQEIIAPSQKNEWRLGAKTDLMIKIQKGDLPLNLSKNNFKDIALQAVGSVERAELYLGQLGSYSLNAFDLSLTSLDNLQIAYRGGIKGKETTEFSGNFSISPEREILFEAASSGFPVSLVEIFSPKTAENLRGLFGKSFDLKTKGTFIEKQLEAAWDVQSSNLQLSGTARGLFPEFLFEAAGHAFLPSKKSQIIGKEINIEAKGNVDFSQDSFTLPQISGKVFNDQIEASFEGKLGQKGEPFNFSQLHFVASGTIERLMNLEAAPIKNGQFILHLDGSKNLIQAKASGFFNEELSTIHFETKNFLKNGDLDLKQAKTAFKFDLNQMPSQLLGISLPNDTELSQLIGSYVTLHGSGNYIPASASSLRLDINAKAQGFSGKFSLAFDEAFKVSQRQPIHLHWEMTPERYKTLLKMLPDQASSSKYQLVQTSPIDMKIQNLNLPSYTAASFFQIGCVAELSVGNLVFKTPENEDTFVITQFMGSIAANKLSEAASLDLRGQLLAKSIPSSEASSFSVKGEIYNPWTAEGKLDASRTAFKGELNFELLPVKQLTEMLPMEEISRRKIQATLGELVNSRIYAEISQMNGPLTVDVKASNFKALLPLYLTPNALLLRDYVEAEITLTEEVNEFFLKDVAPIVFKGAYSDHPVKVYIEPEGFLLPIRPYDLQRAQIGKAIIDIGRIRVQNGGQIQALMEFLKAKDISADRFMEAWFTPIFMSLQNGVASYKRCDALFAGNVHIAVWGNINLVQDKVRMTLGIAPTTLKQRFNVLGLNKKDMFQVKMRGSTDKLDLDWSSAYTRIGILLTRTAGGPYGYILGGIVEQLVNILGEEPSPPPTADPFPWSKKGQAELSEGIPSEAAPKKNGGKSGFKKIFEFLIP